MKLVRKQLKENWYMILPVITDILMTIAASVHIGKILYGYNRWYRMIDLNGTFGLLVLFATLSSMLLTVLMYLTINGNKTHELAAQKCTSATVVCFLIIALGDLV